MLFNVLQATNGILVESNPPFWDWLIPLMYFVGILSICVLIVTLVLAIDGEISFWWVSSTCVVAAALFTFTGIIHSNLEKTDGYEAISSKIFETYGVEVTAAELEENGLHRVLKKNAVTRINLTEKQSAIVRDEESGSFEQGKDAKYALVVDGRVIELVKLEETQDGFTLTPIESIQSMK